MTSNSVIIETERRLLKCLGYSLKPSNDSFDISNLCDDELERICFLADRHEVLTLLGDIMSQNHLPEKIKKFFQFKTMKTLHKGIMLQSLNTRLTELLKKEGIIAITLKGFAVSRFYPTPELRKTTDLDLFFASLKDAQKAEKILCKNGFKPTEEWHANHHKVLISEKNEKVELHTSWADEFKDKHLNNCIEEIQKESFLHYLPIDSNEVKIYVYDAVYQAFYLIIHMLGHFVAGGFGLRNLCDWVVLWENNLDENVKNDFLKIVRHSKIEKFAKAVTSVCVAYLGLSMEKSPFAPENLTDDKLTDEFLRDILDAGEFGYSEADRMVGMDGSSFVSYIKEFHHQMHINFPKLGKIALFWPVLWLATLFRFLNNNRKYNRAPVSAIMKKAGNRGKLVKKLTSNN